jgi:hypothetical protein
MTSILYYFLIYNFYIFLILISGQIFKKIIWSNNSKDLTIGELGIFGFVFVYFLVTIFHFFLPINLYFTLIFYSVCIIFFLIEFRNINYFVFSNINKSVIFLYSLGFLTAVTSNLHDDWQIYQMPIITYMQQFKIIFGFTSLNDYYGQGHSFYEIMSVFQIPYLKNSAVYLLPVVFTVFFLSHILIEIKKSDNKGKFFLFFILALILLRFSRSKEYGTDLPVLCLLFMIQIYVLNFLKEPNKEVIFKAAIFFIFGVFLKIYASLAIFYSLFLLKKKNFRFIGELFKLNKVSIFILLLITASFAKNIITSGCLFYQISNTCLDKNLASWSIGKQVAKERDTFLSAAVRGWKAYVRTEQPKRFVSASEYLELSKYNYLKYLSKDAIFDRLIITLSIFAIFVLFHFKYLRKKNKNDQHSSSKILLFTSLIAVVIWIIKVPNVRYGGYAYVPFFLFVLIFYFYDLAKLNTKFIKTFIGLCLVFFITKNTNRIYDELSLNSSNNYPFANFKKFNYKTIKINKLDINVPTDQLWCGETKMPCSSGDYLVSDVIIKNSYIFLLSKQKDLLKFINRTSYYDTIEENDVNREDFKQ